MPPTLADPAAAAIIDPAALDEDDPKLIYFGKHAARVGTRRIVTERRESANESGLFEEVPGVPFQGIFLQPSPAHDAHLNDKNAAAGTRDQAPESAIQRLARQLRLENRDLTLSGEAGRRVVFGASAAVRHVLSPDHSTITFADETEITAQWLMAVPLRLARDWTWDALTDEGLQVFRSINGGARELVGIISPRKTLNTTAVRRGVALDRSTTDLFFFDAIDPKPAPGEFPSEIEVTYTVVPQFRQAPEPPAPEWTDTVRLPMAAPPTQVPQIVSAGIALSPYERDENYSKTEPRRRMLWIEFAEPVANPRDAYFARVTMHSADPMLIRRRTRAAARSARAAAEHRPRAHPLDRRRTSPKIHRGWKRCSASHPPKATDRSGIFFCRSRRRCRKSRPNFSVSSSTSFASAMPRAGPQPRQRFGLPQRVTGVQHPAPVLTCSVSRTAEHIRVSAPYATPVADGQILRAEPPTSDLWALLYVQVRLADASDWRNILIGRTRLTFSDLAFRGRSGSEPHGFGYCDQDEIEAWLEALGLPHNSPLSVLAVELLPEPDSPFMDPLGKDLGQVRVLRTSPLTPVPAICLDV